MPSDRECRTWKWILVPLAVEITGLLKPEVRGGIKFLPAIFPNVCFTTSNVRGKLVLETYILPIKFNYYK